ncbi:MAG TPA: calcium-binding protein, partial [Azospirillaceae bacterium]|nr:calcium-binding protein [Azospirillaceae bacterium]
PASSSPIQIAGLRDGGYALAWESPDDSGGGIRTQRFDANGQAAGPPQDAAALPLYTQSRPTITGLADGGYVVLWQINIGVNSPTPGWDVKGQRFDASGAKVGSEFQVNTAAAGDQFEASTAVLADGGFVVVWRSLSEGNGRSDVYAQRFDAAGAKVGGEIHVNGITTGYQGKPDVVGLANGGFVVAWASLSLDGSESGIQAQHFDAAGASVGGEFRLNGDTAGRQYDVVLSARPDGGFSAVWTSEFQDGYGAGLVTRSFVTRLEIRGTAGNDTLMGSGLNEIVTGLDGNDHLSGGGGNDWLYGGRGEDVLEGGSGADIIHGGFYAMDGDGALDSASYAGSTSGVYINLAEGRGFNASADGDRLYGIERLIGSAFEDYLIGQEVANGWGTYFDAARYLASNPDLRATFGTDLARATRHWENTGHLEARHGAMMVSGSVIASGDGNDTVKGGRRDDYLLGGTGNDRLEGHAGHDWLYGEAGGDTLNGGQGDDRLYGGEGSDQLTGEQDEDLLVGGAGADIIQGAFNTAGGDTAMDTASYAGSAGGVYVNLAEGRGLRADAEGDRLYGIERVVGSKYDDHLVGQEAVTPWGTYFDAARYLASNPDLRAAFGTDHARATQHWETTGHLEARHGAMMVGGSILVADAGNDTVHGGIHNDYLLGGTGNDQVHGQGGHDWLYGEAGSDTLNGGDHGDRLYGGDGSDTLDGGSGDDRLYGGLGSDTVYGGSGNDLFLGTAAELTGDHIQDFGRGDRLVVLGRNLSHLSGTAATSRVGVGSEWWEYVTLSGPEMSMARFQAYWDGTKTDIWLV